MSADPKTIESYVQHTEDYPLERLIPQDAAIDPDVAMNHILLISFLTDEAALKRQNEFQMAEEYALQQCMLQCKRDGRMQPSKTADTDINDDQRENMMKGIEEQIAAGQLSAQQIAQYERSKAFQEQLAAIPYAEKPASADVGEEPEQFADSIPQTFARSIVSPEEEVVARIDSERRQQRQKADKNVASKSQQSGPEASVEQGDDDDDDDPAVLLSSTAPRTVVVETDIEDIYAESDQAPRLAPEDLRPAIPEGARPAEPTPEQLEKDKLNPKIDLIPVKERVNRWYYAGKFDDNEHLSEEELKDLLEKKKEQETPKFDDPNIAGMVADGTAVPIINQGPLQRNDLPPLYEEGPKHREKVLTTNYDPAKDRPFLWNKKHRYIIVSTIGPNCPQKAPRNLVRVWAVVKDKGEAQSAMKAIQLKNTYAHMWDFYLYSMQRWFAVVPKGENDNGTVMEGNEKFKEYLQSSFDNRKKAAVELEQRALDAKAAERATTGQTLLEQLKAKKMGDGL